MRILPPFCEKSFENRSVHRMGGYIIHSRSMIDVNFAATWLAMFFKFGFATASLFSKGFMAETSVFRVFAFLHHHIAGEHRSDPALQLKSLVGKGRVAGTENFVLLENQC
jgi:hypothetical protein